MKGHNIKERSIFPLNYSTNFILVETEMIHLEFEEKNNSKIQMK